MNIDEILSRFEGVQSRGARFIALCPAHPDQHPSLSIGEGYRGLLIKCWSGCTIAEICRAIGITPQALFYDAPETDPTKRKAGARQRETERKQREVTARKLGRLLDACKQAEHYLQSRQPVDIRSWSDQQLSRELNLIADAFKILERDPYAAAS